MKRRLWIPVAVLAAASLGASLTSCNATSCGPGTVQQQQKDGTLKCEPVDAQAATIPCDVDGGNVIIVGGKCVSAIQCDPATTMNQNGTCYGSGTVGKPKCSTPASGKACIFGDIYNFTDHVLNTEPVHVELWDPTVLLSGGNPIAATDLTSAADGYAFQDFSAPPLNLVVVLTRTLTGGTQMTSAGTGASGVTMNNVYRMDAYAIKKADSDQWGFDITAQGAEIALYFKDAKPAPNLLIANEGMPASGVVVTEPSGGTPAAMYFNDTLTQVDGTLMATGAKGGAIFPAPVSGTFPAFSGMGGGVTTWETEPGGSQANLVLITRFHPGP